MKVTVKKNLIIFHQWQDWEMVMSRLTADFGIRIRMRHIMRRELGFTVREHKGLIPYGKNKKTGKTEMRYQQQIHLDFFTESALSWFQLKYLNLSNTEVLLF